MNRMDRTLILIFCETRQELLSKYIGLELLRRKQIEMNEKSHIKKVLDNIMKDDKDIIAENDKRLEEMKDNEYEEYREAEMDKLDKKHDMKRMAKEKEMKDKRDKIMKLEKKKDKLEGTLDSYELAANKKDKRNEDLKIMKMNEVERKQEMERELAEIEERGDKVSVDDRGIIQTIKSMVQEKEEEVEERRSDEEFSLELTEEEKQAIKQKGGMKDKEIYGYSPEAIDKICKKINDTRQVHRNDVEVMDECKF